MNSNSPDETAITQTELNRYLEAQANAIAQLKLMRSLTSAAFSGSPPKETP